MSTNNFSSVFILLIIMGWARLGLGQPTDSKENKEWCGTTEIEQLMLEENPELKEIKIGIEEFATQYVNNPKKELDGDIVVIPVVFHVIHDGDALGVGQNILDTYIFAQIEQLNDDFRRTNSDADSTWPQAADTEIEFCLAEIDPVGNATTGITRHDINGGPWTQTSFNTSVKPTTIWDRDNYLNIWTADLAGTLLGYAQFPGGNANTDGVVNKYNTTGSISTPFPGGGNYAIGRIAAHEVGHWLNLRHIWGDGPCGSDDFVSDTPVSDAANTGCPVNHTSCGTVDMVQNYMDYTLSSCMNLFTAGQRDRMQATVAFGGIRSSLRTAVCGFAPEAPIAMFSPDSGPIEYCGTDTDISFTDQSLQNPNSWTWVFSGAGVSPTSSTDQNPTINVTEEGDLFVSLTVENMAGADVVEKLIFIDNLGSTPVECATTPCLEFQGSLSMNLNYGDACALNDCISYSQGKEVWGGEAYTLGGLQDGFTYSFDFCTGYNLQNWNAVITIGLYDPITEEAIEGSELTWINDCAITFTPIVGGDYIAVVSILDSCFSQGNQIDNGAPTFQCVDACDSYCDIAFYDKGGSQFDYPTLENKTYILCPDELGCQSMRMSFKSFSLGSSGDFFRVYDGDNTGASLIGEYTMGSPPPTIMEANNPTGCFTIHFTSDFGNTGPGWDAAVTCFDNGSCVGDCPDENYNGNDSLSGVEDGTGGPTNDGNYLSIDCIESSQQVISGPVFYNSNNCIDLEIGFEVQSSAEFEATTEGCTGN